MVSSASVDRKRIEPTPAAGREILSVQFALKTEFDQVPRDQVGSMKDMARGEPSQLFFQREIEALSDPIGKGVQRKLFEGGGQLPG